MKKHWIKLIVLVSIFALPRLAEAQELVTGWEGGPSYGYAFASPVFSVPLSSQNIFVLRPTLSYLYYDFGQGDGFTKVKSPGAGLQLGYRRQTRRLTYTITPGFEVRRDDRLLFNGRRSVNTEIGAVIQGEAFFQATRLINLNLISNYGTADHYVWTRVGFKRQVTGSKKEGRGLDLGTELNGQGNADVHQLEAGGLIEVPLWSSSSLQFRSGYAHLWFADGSTQVRPYVGVGFYRHF